MLNHVLHGFLLGQLLAGPIGGIFGQWLGWQSVFLLLSLAGGIATVLLALHLRTFPDRRAISVRSYGADYIRLALDGRARRLLVATLIEGATMAGSFPFIAPFLVNTFGLTYAASGVVVMIFGMGAFLYTFNAKHLLTRFGEVGLAMLGGILVIAGFATVAASPTWYLLTLAALMLGLGYFTLHSVLQTRATELLPRARSTAISAFVFMLFAGQSLGALIMGGTIAWLGYRWAFFIDAVAILLLILWLRRLLDEPRQSSTH
jgi:predicted MFS family arabinose efflux permease